MRDLVFAAALVIVIPIALMRPFAAFLVWCWTALMIPTSYLYGFMANTRINLIFALITLSLIILGRVNRVEYVNNRVTWLFVIFLTHGTISMIFGYQGNPFNSEYFIYLVKLMAFALVMPLFLKDRIHLHAFILVMVIGMSLHGLLDGLKTIASGGGHNMYGPAGTMIADRNHLSAALAMMLPLVYYLHSSSRNKLVRWGFWGLFIIVAIAIIGGRSRGGFLALSVIGLWIVFVSQHKFRTVLLVTIAASSLLSIAPDEWFSRISTIRDAGEDESFMGRVIAWRISSALALENPIFGGGFHAVQVQEIWDRFKAAPGLLGFLNFGVPEFGAKAAHSIYFEVMGDLGFLGLAIFLFIMLQSIYARFEIKRMVKQSRPKSTWAQDMADMLMLSVLAYLVGGAGVSLAYFEPIYMIIMLMELLRQYMKRQTRSEFVVRSGAS